MQRASRWFLTLLIAVTGTVKVFDDDLALVAVGVAEIGIACILLTRWHFVAYLLIALLVVIGLVGTLMDPGSECGCLGSSIRLSAWGRVFLTSLTMFFVLGAVAAEFRAPASASCRLPVH